MSEKKTLTEKLKDALEWLHHAYWIYEFLGSAGFWGIIVTWITHTLPALRDYKWFVILLLAGLSVYGFGIAHKGDDSGQRSQSAAEANQTRNAEQGSEAARADDKERTNALLRSASPQPGVFDSESFFRLAYYSVLQDVASNSFRNEAQRVRPQDRESFYLDVLGIGTVAYGYDVIWWPLFRSQLLALLELNKSGGLMPKTKFGTFYEEASLKYPKEYEEITLDNWIQYLEGNTLLKVHPSEMVEITVKGKDFLKYLLHTGKTADTKRL